MDLNSKPKRKWSKVSDSRLVSDRILLSFFDFVVGRDALFFGRYYEVYYFDLLPIEFIIGKCAADNCWAESCAENRT